MKRIVLTAVALALLVAVAVAAAPKSALPLSASLAVQSQNNQQPQIQTFTGSISKTGDQFVFIDEATKSSYRLDDQQTASKFAGKKVKVTGTLDAANNSIRVQSIEAA